MPRKWFTKWIAGDKKLADELNKIEDEGFTVYTVFPRRFESGKPGNEVLYYSGNRTDTLPVIVTNETLKTESAPVTVKVADGLKVEVTNPAKQVEVTNTVKTEVTNTGAILVDTSGKKSK